MARTPKALPRGTGKTSGGRSYERGSTQHVLEPDNPHYRGRFGPDAPGFARNPEEGEQLYRDWHKGHTQREENIKIDQANRKQYRRLGQVGMAIVGVPSGIAALGGERNRRQLQRENAVLRAKLSKGWSREDPLMWLASRKGKAHKVTIMGEKPPWEGKPKGVSERVGRRLHSVMEYGDGAALVEAAGLAGIGAGAGVAYARTRGPAKEKRSLQGKLAAQTRRERKLAAASVAKARGAVRATVRTGLPPQGPITAQEHARREAVAAARAARGAPKEQVKKPKQPNRTPEEAQKLRAQERWKLRAKAEPSVLAVPAFGATWAASLAHEKSRPFPQQRQGERSLVAVGKREPGDKTSSEGARAAGYAVGGNLAFRGVGYGLKRSGERARRGAQGHRPAGMSRKEYDDILGDHEAKHGIKDYGERGSFEHRTQLGNAPKFNREYPKKLLGWRQKRMLGQISGGRGVAASIASTAVPAAYAVNTTKRPGEVGKAVTYGYMEERRSKRRTAGQAAGLAVAAGGASHLQVGRAVARGQRLADVKGYGREYRQGADVVRRGRNQARSISGQAVTGLRNRIPGFGTALEFIPPKLRPHAAVGGGLYLAARSTPSKQERFVPTGRF